MENGHLLRGNLINGAVLGHHIHVVTSPQTKSFHTHGGSTVKNPPAMQEPKETQVQYLVWEDPLEEEMVTHSSTLAHRIPWTEGPGRLRLQGVRHDWSNLASPHLLYTEILWGLPHFIDEVRGFPLDFRQSCHFFWGKAHLSAQWSYPHHSISWLSLWRQNLLLSLNSPPGSHDPCSNSLHMPHPHPKMEFCQCHQY